MIDLMAAPVPPRLREQEVLVWRGAPCWRTLAKRVFHIRAVALYSCVLVLANAVAARMQGLSAADSLHGEAPVVIFCGLLTAGVALAAWATARTTLYTVTNQRVILQYGLALNATLVLPMRLIASVAVSAGEIGDVPLQLKTGRAVPFVKLWPHTRPWRITRPEPMLRALPDATVVAAQISRVVADAQAVELAGSLQRPAARTIEALAA